MQEYLDDLIVITVVMGIMTLTVIFYTLLRIAIQMVLKQRKKEKDQEIHEKWMREVYEPHVLRALRQPPEISPEEWAEIQERTQRRLLEEVNLASARMLPASHAREHTQTPNGHSRTH